MADGLEGFPASEMRPNSSHSSDSIHKEIKDVAVILQSLCHLHRWTRTSSDAAIYERSERLRSIRLGIAIAHGRLRASAPHLASSNTSSVKGKEKANSDVDPAASLEDLLGGLSLNGTSSSSTLYEGYPFGIYSTARRTPLSSSALVPSATSLAHGEAYIPQLLSYISNVPSAHASQSSEVPLSLSQGDLYLCDRSLEALEGALGACCEGIDQVCAQGRKGGKRFVSVRPPGHHCETETPMGFCWLNNVVVAATYGTIKRCLLCLASLSISAPVFSPSRTWYREDRYFRHRPAPR